MSQDILFNIANSFSSVIKATNTNALNQTPIEPTSTQSLSFFDPSFFAQCKVFEIFFLPSDTLLTLPDLLQAQKDDTVLSIVYKWLKQKQRPHSSNPIIRANSFLYTYYRQFHTYILIHILSNIIHQIPEYLKKSLSKLNLLIIKLASLHHLFTIGTIRNYDLAKQYYFLTSYLDPTRPLFVPQEAFNWNDDYILPTHIPTAVPNFSPK